jgi:tetratricopeptide (TPR) repeat protein
MVNKDIQMNNEELNFEKLWNYSDPASTRQTFQEILESGRFDEDPDKSAELNTQIARTYSLSADFKNAHLILDEVQQSISKETPRAKVRYLLERGRTYNSAGEKERASSLFKDAYKAAKEFKFDYFAIDAVHMLAIVSQSLEEKLKWTDVGIALAKESEDSGTKKWIGVFYNNKGWDYFAAKEYNKSLEAFKDCEDFHVEYENKNQLSIARWSQAKALRFLGKNKESLEIQLDLLEEGGGKDSSGYTYEELGELYLAQKDQTKSQFYFAKAFHLLSQDVWLQMNEKPRLERLKKLSGN